MNKNQKVRVRSDHPHHPNREGFFQFHGEGPSEGVVVLSTGPGDIENPPATGLTTFAVGKEDIILVMDFGQLIQYLADSLGDCTGEEIAQMVSQYSGSKVTYLDDDVWEVEESKEES